MTTLGNKTLTGGLSASTVSTGVQYGVSRLTGSLPNGGAAPLTMTQNGWLTTLGGRVKVASGSNSIYWAVWLGESPTTLLARTATVAVDTNDANREGGVAWTATEHDSALRLTSGQILTLGLKAETGDPVLLSYIGSATTGPLVNPTYTRHIGAGLPGDPFAPSVTAQVPYRAAIYAEFTANSAPNAPTSLSPANLASVKADAVTFGGTFSDPDTGAPTYDALWAYEFEVRDANTLTDLWSGPSALFLANVAQQEAGSFTQAYAGTTLTGGQDIEWRARCYDIHHEPGAWSAWRTIAIALNGVVVMTAPTGKVDGPTDEIGWAGTYTHVGSLAATTLQLRVIKNDVVYLEGAEFAKAITSGASWTAAYSADGGIGLLGQGLALGVQARAKDSDGNWGRWSVPLAFSTNAIPTVPAALEPQSGDSATERPTLSWASRDTDADDIEGTDVQWTVEITRPDTTVHTYTATAYDTTTGRASLAMTGTHMPTYGIYSWRVKADDLSASDGESDWSTPALFSYQDGIVVSVSAPTDGQALATLTPAVTFSISAGSIVQRRLTLYLPGSNTAIYDTGIETSGANTFTVPAGVLFNTQSYDAVVWARNDDTPIPEEGTSARRRFAVSFATPATPQGVSISEYALPGSPEPTAALLSWQRTDLPLDQFGGYQISRKRASDSTPTTLLILGNPHQTRWIDLFAPADGSITYTVTTLRKLGNGQTTAASASSASIDLALSVVVITSTGADQRSAVLRWKPASRRGSYEQPKEKYVTWGADGVPIVAFGSGTAENVDDQFTIIGDEQATRDAHFQNLRELYKLRIPVCYRSEQTRFFGIIEEFRWEISDNKIVVWLRVEQTAFKEGL